MNIQQMTALICASLLIAGCSATQKSSSGTPSMDQMLAQLTEQDGRACIRISDIKGYGPLSDHMLSVSGRRKEHFLVTTMYSCLSMSDSLGVAFSASFAEVCGGGMSRVTTRSESCPIKHIFKFASRDDAFTTIDVAKARREAIEQFPDSVEP